MGVLRHSYFFVDLQTILQEYGLVCKEFFCFLKQGRKEWRDSAAFGIVGNVYNSPSYGAVGNTVCRMWESCPLLFHML